MRRLIEVTMKALALGLFLLGPLPAGPAEKIPPPAERPAEKPGDRTPSIAERAKDLARHDGFLPFYWDARKGQLAGFKDAFVLKDLPEGATFLDARYSGIEWINRVERGWSVGGSQTDPRTGEILHGVARSRRTSRSKTGSPGVRGTARSPARITRTHS